MPAAPVAGFVFLDSISAGLFVVTLFLGSILLSFFGVVIVDCACFVLTMTPNRETAHESGFFFESKNEVIGFFVSASRPGRTRRLHQHRNATMAKTRERSAERYVQAAAYFIGTTCY